MKIIGSEAVRQYVPADKLLIFQVKESWEPLCAFLNLPVPDRPFPHVNDREMILRRFKMLQLGLTWLPLGAAAALGLIFLRLLRHKLQPASKQA